MDSKILVVVSIREITPRAGDVVPKLLANLLVFGFGLGVLLPTTAFLWWQRRNDFKDFVVFFFRILGGLASLGSVQARFHFELPQVIRFVAKCKRRHDGRVACTVRQIDSTQYCFASLLVMARLFSTLARQSLAQGAGRSSVLFQSAAAVLAPSLSVCKDERQRFGELEKENSARLNVPGRLEGNAPILWRVNPETLITSIIPLSTIFIARPVLVAAPLFFALLFIVLQDTSNSRIVDCFPTTSALCRSTLLSPEKRCGWYNKLLRRRGRSRRKAQRSQPWSGSGVPPRASV